MACNWDTDHEKAVRRGAAIRQCRFEGNTVRCVTKFHDGGGGQRPHNVA